jgi:hypothetical protein
MANLTTLDTIANLKPIVRDRLTLTEQAHPYAHSNDVETEIICDTEIVV